ncbi:MAG: hypothetical protein RCG15_01655 [Candidatus Rickettsia vulgarisii]
MSIYKTAYALLLRTTFKNQERTRSIKQDLQEVRRGDFNNKTIVIQNIEDTFLSTYTDNSENISSISLSSLSTNKDSEIILISNELFNQFYQSKNFRLSTIY